MGAAPNGEPGYSPDASLNLIGGQSDQSVFGKEHHA